MSLKRINSIVESVSLGKIKVYRGQDYEGTPYSGLLFFSEDLDFAKDYGEVKEYELLVSNFFDLLDERDFNYLIEKEGILEDPYDGEEYDNFQDLSTNISSDTWEITEYYIDDIDSSDYSGVVVYEGGHRNFIVWDKSLVKLVGD